MEESCPTGCHGSVKVSHLNDQGLGGPSSQSVKEDSMPIEGVAHTQPGTSEYCMNVTTNNGEFSSQFLELAELYFEDMTRDVLKACHSNKALIYFKSARALEKALAMTVHSIDDKLTVIVSKCELQSQPKPALEKALATTVHSVDDELTVTFSKCELQPQPKPRRVLNRPNSISKGGCNSQSQESKSLPDDSPVPGLSNDPTPAGLQSLGSDTVKTPQNLCFQIIKGSLSEQEADVLVNSVHPSGQLACGAISKSLLNAAGSGLQDEISRSYPNGIGGNAFVVTSGRRLKCKHVFHVALERFGGSSSEQVLYDLILSCLKEAHGRSLNSIAFPAIGTGVLGYPLHIAADKFHSAVEAFSAEYPYTTLKRIICVAFDSPTHKAFKDRMDLRLSAGAVSASSSSSMPSASNRARSRGSADVSNVDSVEVVSRDSREQRMLSEEGQEIVIEGLRLHFVVGDIADESTDVIVNSTTHDLYLGGAVSKALLKKGGEDLKHVCRNAGIVGRSRALVTSPGQLNCKHLMHLDVVGVRTNTDYEKLIAEALKKADELKAKSLAMPAVGVSLGQSVGALAKGLAGALVKFCTSCRSRHLELLRVVLTNDGMRKDLHSAVRGTPELKEIAATHTSSSSVKGMPLAGAPHDVDKILKRRIL